MPRPTPLCLTALALLALLGLGLSAASLEAQAAPAPFGVFLPSLGCHGCTGDANQPPPTPRPNPSAFVADEIELINEARAAVGCAAVTPNSALMQGAQAWSETMYRERIYQHTLGGYYSNFGYTIGPSVENIGSGERPEFVFEAWMASPHHRSNIEWCIPLNDPSYDPARVYDIGVGYISGYWTMAIGSHVP